MYASPKSVSNLSPRTDRHTKRGVNVRKDTKRSDRVDFKAYPFRGLTTKKSGSGAFNWGNMPSPDDLLEWEHEVGSMHSDDEEDPGDEGYFLGRPLEAFVSDDEENSRDALGAALAPDDAKTRARRGAPEGESMALDDVFLDRERAQFGRGADDDARAPLCELSVLELYATKRRVERELAAAEFVRVLTHKSEPVPAWVLAPEHKLQEERDDVLAALRARAETLELPDDSEPVPLSELSVLELYATKRRAERELAAAEFVRVLTHKSEPVPEWVLAPERKLQAEIRNVVGALRARARALPADPGELVDPGELNANELVGDAALDAGALFASLTAPPRAADRGARGGNKPPLRKAAAPGDDGGDGGRRPSRRGRRAGSKRAGRGAYNWGDTLEDAARGGLGELADDDDDEPLLTVDEVLAPRVPEPITVRDAAIVSVRAVGGGRHGARARRGANRGADAPIRPRPPLQAMRVVELYARKRMLTKELAAAEFVRKITHKSRPVPKWVLAPEEVLRAEIRRVKRALRDRATALPIAPVEPGAAARGRSPAPREETPPATPPAPPSSPKARRDSPAPTASPKEPRAVLSHKEQRRVKKLLVLLEYRKTTTDDAEKAEKAAADMAAEIAALEAKALKRAAARGRQGDDRNYLAALEKAA